MCPSRSDQGSRLARDNDRVPLGAKVLHRSDQGSRLVRIRVCDPLGERPSCANDILWYEEMPLWKGTKDVALWEKMGRGRAGIKLYVVAVENVANDLLSATVLSSGGSFIVYDNFCYDQERQFICGNWKG